MRGQLPQELSRRDILRLTVATPGLGVTPSSEQPSGMRQVELRSSACAPPESQSDPVGSVRPEAFSITGVFDVDWLSTPRFQRLLDNFVASPRAFQTIRFFGSLNSGAKENTTPAGDGRVWPSVDEPIDFSTTFDALHALTSRGLIPYIVLCFFPRAISESPIQPPSSFDDWKHLVQQFLEELQSDPRFGDAIYDWWFEVWNEPNIPTFWRGDFAQYLDLYRATSEAVVKAGYTDIRLGGPTLAYFPYGAPDSGARLMEMFVQFLSDNPDLKCDFISLHGKGSSGHSKPTLQRPITAVRETAAMALSIDRDRFSGISIVNNEDDMKVGFDIPFELRMTEQFPAWLSAVTIAYDRLSTRYQQDGIRFLAASDNANQQLIRAPFDGRRSVMTRASGSPTDLFKVPVYNFYELLRLLGDRHGTFLTGREKYFPYTDLFHMNTVAESHLGLLFSVYPWDGSNPSISRTLEYTLVDVPWSTVNIARFQIDRTHSNAYTEAGRSLSIPSPGTPEARRIRQAQELTVFSPIERCIDLADDEFHRTFTIDPFTSILYWITPTLPDAPAAPCWVETTVDDGNVILQWEPNCEPFFYSYEVYLMNDGQPATQLSPTPLRAARWVDTAPSTETRRYGVRAVSASGVTSELVTSEPVSIS